VMRMEATAIAEDANRLSTRSYGRRNHVAASDHGRLEFHSGKAEAM
jgi:hypothetical protein